MGGVFWVSSRTDWSRHLKETVALTLLSLVFFGTAAAQLRSGYLWQNLAPGNRGLHRSKAPRRFVMSTIGHTALGTIIVTFAWWGYASRL